MRLQTALLALALVPACKDEAPKDGENTHVKAGGGEADAGKADAGKDDAGKDDAGKADAGKDDAGKADAGGDGAAPPTPASNAAGGAVYPPDTIKECPKSLSGKDNVSRVITKECGVVPVTGKYRMEGGTLFLEAGATLAFADGVAMEIGYSASSKLVTRGTKEAPVTLTASGDKVPGVWNGVHIYNKGARSSLAHTVIEWAGTKQALLIDAEDVSVEGLTVRGAKAPAVVVGGKATLTKFDGNTFENVDEQAMRIPPQQAGGIGASNKWPEGAVVQVTGGKIEEDVTWANIGAPWHVTGKIKVLGESGNRATFTLAAGSEVRFDGDAGVEVGYSSEGTLVAAGTKEAPVVFDADEKKEAGAWSGLAIYSKGEAEIDHAIFRHAGKKETYGALYIAETAQLTLTNSTFESTVVGVVAKSGKSEIRKFENNTFKSTPKAMSMVARHLGSLADSNVYGDDAIIEVLADTIDKDGTWAVQKDARVELHGKVKVQGGRLTIPAGSKMHVKDGVVFEVGYSDTGSMELLGTTASPIELVGLRDDPGAWKGIVFYSKAHGAKVEHVKLRNAGGKAAIEFQNDSSGTVKELSCDKCAAPALTWTCKSKVEQSGVTGGEGTPMPAEIPVCK